MYLKLETTVDRGFFPHGRLIFAVFAVGMQFTKITRREALKVSELTKNNKEKL